MSMKSEIFEQASILGKLVTNQWSTAEKIAAEIRRAAPDFVFLAARGTSDNAGRYASYLWGATNRMPIALATPSLFTYYQAPPRLNHALVIGISQSGQSQDIVSVVTEGHRQGCPTLAITNDTSSPLAKAADLVFDICAGEEKAVAASKTYTAQLAAIAMISAALSGDPEMRRSLERLPGWIEEVLAHDERLASLAERYRYMQQCVVLGRGYNYATAYEWSLKIKELTYAVADPYSPADFKHGPIALVEPGFPIMAAAPGGMVFADMLALLRSLVEEHACEIMVISDQPEALALARSPVALPAGIPEWLTPMVSIVPAQLFTMYLAATRGLDVEAPRGLRKVTVTR